MRMNGPASTVLPRAIGRVVTTPRPLPLMGISCNRPASGRTILAAEVFEDTWRRTAFRLEKRDGRRSVVGTDGTARIGVAVKSALEILKQQVVAVAAADVVGQERN